LSEIVHAAHAVLAGVWLGGVIFTMGDVSRASTARKWVGAELDVISTPGRGTTIQLRFDNR